MPDVSRVDAGRRRAAAAKRAVALTAAGGFVVVLGLARQAHPGTAAPTPLPRSPSTGLSSDAQQGYSLGGGWIGPPSGGSSAPQVQTATS
jgi:hypothetical protein